MKRLMMLALVAAVMTGCASASGGPPAEIACEVSYRPSVAVPIQESRTITVSPENREEAVAAKFQDLSFQAAYTVPPTESPALLVSVLSHEGRTVTSTLYQIPREGRMVNQFSGGHGFSGLVYVYAPASGAELQYNCRVP